MDAATGKVRWTYKTQAEIKSSPVVVGDKVLIGSCDGHLYGLNAATGKFLWKVSTDNYVHATPAIWNGVAYFGGCDEVFHGVRISDGVEVVSLTTEAYTAASPAIAAGIAYYGTFANEVVAVDIAAKKVKWRFVDPDRQFLFHSSAALSNGVAVLGGRDKNVRAIDMATGKQRWVFPTRARVESSPCGRRHAWLSVPATASSMCWTWPPARRSGSSKPARRSPPHLPSPAAESSSATATGDSTPSVNNAWA